MREYFVCNQTENLYDKTLPIKNWYGNDIEEVKILSNKSINISINLINKINKGHVEDGILRIGRDSFCHKFDPNEKAIANQSKVWYAPHDKFMEYYKKLIEQFKKLRNKPQNPIVLATWFYYNFLITHPYMDGNGRTARELYNMILDCYDGYEGFKKSVIRKPNVSCLEFPLFYEALNGNFAPLLLFNFRNLEKSLY